MSAVVTGVFYDLQTGRILYSGTVPVIDSVGPEGFIATPDFRNDYDITHRVDVNGPFPLLLERVPVPYSLNRETIIANGSDEARITGLPAAARALLDDEITDVVGNELRFAADLPGTYRITVMSPIHLDTVVEITAI